MLFVVVIETSMYSYSAFNIVYDKSKSIKTQMYCHKITMAQYYLGKFLADLFIIAATQPLVYLGMKYILDEDFEDQEIRLALQVPFLKIQIWKVAYISFSYLLSRFFQDTRTLLKYESIAHYSLMGITGILHRFLKLNLTFLVDIDFILQHFSVDDEMLLGNFIFVVLSLSVFYWAITLLWENYEI
jgi:hypothetical protein